MSKTHRKAADGTQSLCGIRLQPSDPRLTLSWRPIWFVNAPYPPSCQRCVTLAKEESQ